MIILDFFLLPSLLSARNRKCTLSAQVSWKIHSVIHLRYANLKSLVQHLLLAAISLGIFLVLAEGGSRLLWYEEHEGNSYCSENDPQLIHRNKPNCEYSLKKTEGKELVRYAFNSCGFRDERSCQLVKESTEAIAVGDSFTFGAMTPIGQTYVRKAEEILKDKIDSNFIFTNAGVSGYDLGQYAAKVRQVLKRKPQLITIGLLPNDLFSDLSPAALQNRAQADKPAEEAYKKIYQSERPWLEQVGRKVIRNSRFLDFLSYLLLSQDEIYMQTYKLRKSEDSYLRSEYSKQWQEKIQNTERLLQQISAEAAKVNAKLLVVAIPQRIQTLLLNEDNLDKLDPWAFSKRIRQICRKNKIPFIDFLETLKGHPSPAQLFYPLDGHLTPEGQELLGKVLAESVIELNLFKDA